MIHDMNALTLTSVQPSSLVSKGIKLPLTIQGQSCLAILDTGATLSYLSPDYIEKHQLPFTRSPSSVPLANNASASIVGYSGPLHVICGTFEFDHSFEICLFVLELIFW